MALVVFLTDYRNRFSPGFRVRFLEGSTERVAMHCDGRSQPLSATKPTILDDGFDDFRFQPTVRPQVSEYFRTKFVKFLPILVRQQVRARVSSSLKCIKFSDVISI